MFALLYVQFVLIRKRPSKMMALQCLIVCLISSKFFCRQLPYNPEILSEKGMLLKEFNFMFQLIEETSTNG
jgi:hypothetical protein